MTAEIKPGPCPACGEVEFLEVVDICKHTNGMECLFAVECAPCGMRGPAHFKKHGGHITAWNRVSDAVHGGKSDE